MRFSLERVLSLTLNATLLVALSAGCAEEPIDPAHNLNMTCCGPLAHSAPFLAITPSLHFQCLLPLSGGQILKQRCSPLCCYQSWGVGERGLRVWWPMDFLGGF